jgi:GT2 family glycosyltransferase
MARRRSHGVAWKASLQAKQQQSFELVIVDDGNTDPDLVRYLRGLAQLGRATLLEQPAQSGFAAAVNRGLALHPDRDVVILHSDAFVANDWLDRLAYHAQSEPGIASVAPFSNRGGTVNYPRLHAPNRLPDAESLAKLDRFFARANAKQSMVLPLLSGPCLYLRREPLATVGPFDGAPLRTDWGVEIDYCFRAAGVGFRHLLAGDVFVGHTSHASFGVQAATKPSAASRR